MNRCYYCQHEGEDVNHVAHVHIGGQGDVEFPACSEKVACLERVDQQRVISDAIFVCYRFNRQRNPDINPERWKCCFANADDLEVRLLAERETVGA